MFQFSSDFSTDHRKHQSGQAGLVVLLMTVALLTIGISVASRTTTDVELSRQEEESNRVFNAAEAGVEKALSEDLNFSGTERSGSVTVDNKNVDYTVRKVNNLKTYLFEGVSAQIDVSSVTSNRNLEIRWERNQCGDEPASILVTVYSNVAGVYRARSAGYNTTCGGPQQNGLTNASASSPYRGRALIAVQSGDEFVRIKPLYNNTEVEVRPSGAWTLPTQYFNVRSVAENDMGEEVRSVEVNRTLPVAPALFDYAVYSGEDIIKN